MLLKKFGRIKNEQEVIFTPENSNNEINFLGKESVCEIVNNRIYFYSDIERENILNLNKKIRELSNEIIIRQINEENENQKIFLHINSHGGDFFMGLSAMDEILNCKVPIYTIIDGCCASAATLISISGKKRFINKHAFILIHQLASEFEGKYDEFLDHKQSLDKFMNIMKEIYLSKTKMSENEINKLMKKDLWLDANDALNLGFVDEII